MRCGRRRLTLVASSVPRSAGRSTRSLDGPRTGRFLVSQLEKTENLHWDYAHRSRPRRAAHGADPTARGRRLGARASQRRRLAIHQLRLSSRSSNHAVLGTIGSVGDAFDNALAESLVDTFKTELIRDRIWRSRGQLELAIVEWVAWFNLHAVRVERGGAARLVRRRRGVDADRVAGGRGPAPRRRSSITVPRTGAPLFARCAGARGDQRRGQRLRGGGDHHPGSSAPKRSAANRPT